MDAATEFYQILESNPGIVQDHRAKPYIEAFAVKIARDPSSLVHQPLLLAVQTGLLNGVSEPVVQQVQKIRDNNGMMGLEPAMVTEALRDFDFQKRSKEPQAPPQTSPKGIPPGGPDPSQLVPDQNPPGKPPEFPNTYTQKPPKGQEAPPPPPEGGQPPPPPPEGQQQPPPPEGQQPPPPPPGQ